MNRKTFIESLLVAFGIGILGQILAQGIAFCYVSFFPNAYERYLESMQSSGLLMGTWYSIVVTVIVAGILEEVIFRGILIKMLQKIQEKFWIVNLLQALLFGIYHGNFFQGSYAFILGCLLGWLQNRYGKIYPCIIAHMVFNLCGNFLF